METTEKSATEARKFLYTVGAKHGKAKARQSFLENFLKVKLALLMKDSAETTMAGKEMDAKTHPDYLELLQGIEIVQEEAITLGWQLKSAEATIDIYRTESANNRAIDKGM